MLNRIKGPVWEDQCGHAGSRFHAQGSYVGSFEGWLEGKIANRKYDLYVFGEVDLGVQHVCIRYGNEGREYMSPGLLVDFIQGSNLSELYRAALELLQLTGKIAWVPDDKKV